MSDLLLDIVTYFTSSGFCAGDGIDAFRDFTPETPDSMISVVEYSGDPGSAVDVSTVHRSFQISVRAKSATESKNKARQLYNALNSSTRFVKLTSERWSLVYLRQSPFKIKVDAAGRNYYGFNIGITSYIDEGGL